MRHVSDDDRKRKAAERLERIARSLRRVERLLSGLEFEGQVHKVAEDAEFIAARLPHYIAGRK